MSTMQEARILSPMAIIAWHMTRVHKSAQLLEPFFQASVAQDWPKAEQLKIKIMQLCDEANLVKRELRLQLSRRIMLPGLVSDMLALIRWQDQIVYKATDIATIIMGARAQFPDQIVLDVGEFLKLSINATEITRCAVELIEQLYENTDSSSHVIDEIEKMISAIDHSEQEIELAQIDIIVKLAVIDCQLGPMEAFTLHKIIEYIGELADRAQSTGHHLEQLLVRVSR